MYIPFLVQRWRRVRKFETTRDARRVTVLFRSELCVLQRAARTRGRAAPQKAMGDRHNGRIRFASGFVAHACWNHERPIAVEENQIRTGESMDNVTLIRVVAGVLAIVVFVILLFRMRKKAPR